MKLLLAALYVFDLLTVSYCQCGPCFPAHLQDMFCSAGHVILALPTKVTSKIVKGGTDTFYRSLVVQVLKQGLPPLRKGSIVTLISSACNGAGCQKFTMRLFGGYIIGAQLNQNGDQMNVGGCGMNKLRSQYTSCEVDLMYAVKQGMGYDCSCQIEHCLQHQADAGLCKSNDKCYIHVTDNKNSTANCKRGLNGKCNWNAC